MKTGSLIESMSMALVALLLSAQLNTIALAQSQASTGSIEGTVMDSNGAVVPDAKVAAKNLQTGLARETMTNAEGLYRLLLLPVGDYDVTIEKQGFATVKHQAIKVQIGQKVPLEVALGAAESVNITAEAPIVETTRTQVSAIVNDKAVSNLPANGRNFIDFVLLTPGFTRDVRTGDISFGGQRGTLNSLQIDGADDNNTFFGQSLGRTGSGRAPYQFSQDAVQEFQVNSNGYSAEFGRAAGAVVKVVTKSGTNEFHGTVFEFYARVGADSNNDSNAFTDRVPGVGRNTFTGPGFVSLDPRITRDISLRQRVRIQLIAEAFNALNRANFTGVNTTFYSLTGTGASARLVTNRSFGLPTTTTEPRIVQLAAKIIF